MFFDEELTIDLTEGYSKLDHPIKVYYQDKNINILTIYNHLRKGAKIGICKYKIRKRKGNL